MIKDLKWPIVVLSFILTLAAIFFLNNWRTSRFIEEPLVKSLTENPYIVFVETSQENNKTKFELQLVGITDFKKTFNDIEQEIKESLGEGQFTVVFFHDNKALQDFYNQVDVMLYEGVRTGNYREIEEEINITAGLMGIDNYQLQVDEKRIYFHAEKDDSLFCKIIDLGG